MVHAGVLAEVELFKDLSKEDLDRVANSVQRRRVARGQSIFMRGDPGSALYVVEEGQVRISTTSDQGEELILRILGPGDTFGELALLDAEPRLTDAVAHKASVLLALHRKDFLPFLQSRPQVVTRLFSVLSEWTRHLTELLGDEAFLGVQARLAKVLLDLSGANDRPGEDGLVISHKVTQSELAGMIGATRRSVNKWLSYYRREGLIRYESGYITLLEPDSLRKHAGWRD